MLRVVDLLVVRTDQKNQRQGKIWEIEKKRVVVIFLQICSVVGVKKKIIRIINLKNNYLPRKQMRNFSVLFHQVRVDIIQ